MRRVSRAIMIKDDQLLLMHRNKFGKQYYSLIGGGIEADETPEQALHRELQEESSIQAKNLRLIMVHELGGAFGTQYVYLCDYAGGEPALAADSEEAAVNAGGENLFQPVWLPLSDLAGAELLPDQLKQALLGYLADGFPEQPVTLTM